MISRILSYPLCAQWRLIGYSGWPESAHMSSRPWTFTVRICIKYQMHVLAQIINIKWTSFIHRCVFPIPDVSDLRIKVYTQLFPFKFFFSLGSCCWVKGEDFTWIKKQENISYEIKWTMPSECVLEHMWTVKAQTSLLICTQNLYCWLTTNMGPKCIFSQRASTLAPLKGRK